MRRPASIAALAAAFLLSAPAAGQGLAVSGPPAPAPERPVAPAGRPAAPVSFSYSQQEGGVIRQGMVGTLSLAPGVSAGVGLYAVTDDSRRAPETRRNWTPMEVGRRSERIAAVGLKLRF